LTQAERLRKSAKASANWRGHKLDQFKHYPKRYNGQKLKGQERAVAICTVCGAYACYDTNPAPNGIDVSGDAVAINCPRQGG